jgi:hypothetical protein
MLLSFGGWAWDEQIREAYANDLEDPRTLVAVSASANRSKGDRDPAGWLPERDVCTYVGNWIAVKARWHLSVDAGGNRPVRPPRRPVRRLHGRAVAALEVAAAASGAFVATALGIRGR